MKQLGMRAELLINVSTEDSRDLTKIKEAKKYASALKRFAMDFKGRKFDMASQPKDGQFTLLVKWDSEKAMQHAERLIEIAEEMEKEALAFYEEIGIKIIGEKINESDTNIL